MFSYLLEIYTVTCANNVTRCSISPEIGRNTSITLTDILDPIVDPVVNNMELTLSADLAMFFAHFLKFFTFHFFGVLLCWICTMNFRKSLNR